MKELRIIIAGGRDFKDYNLLSSTIMQYLEDVDDTGIVSNPKQVKFISGTARGADSLGEQFAYTWGYDVVKVPGRLGYTWKECRLQKKCRDGNICF